MDHVVKIKKGLDIQLEGIPSPKTSNTPDSQLYAIIPDDFVGLTPKVIVKPGEKHKLTAFHGSCIIKLNLVRRHFSGTYRT